MRARFFLGVMFLLTVCLMPTQAAWQYHLPSTGLLPSSASFTMLAPAGARHNAGESMGMVTWETTIPLSDPRRTSYNDWYFNAFLDAQLTHCSATGAYLPDSRRLTTLTLPLSAIHPLPQDHRLILTLAPFIATDFNGPAHSASMAAYADYRFLCTERLSASLGMGCMPNELRYWVVPVLSFEWKPTPDWCISYQGVHFQAMRHIAHGASLGLFARGDGGSWATHDAEGTRLLRLRTLVAGTRAEWNFARPGERKRILFANVGCSLLTSAEKLRYGHLRESESMHHYHPAFYVSAGVDFRF